MTDSADPHVWMIRTSENVLSGPYTQKQLVQLIEEEKLELTDEICRGNGYWIYLHEEQEVKRLLGIEVPAALVEFEEPTQTDTAIVRASVVVQESRAQSESKMGSMGSMAVAGMASRAPNRDQRNTTISEAASANGSGMVAHTAVSAERAHSQESSGEQDVPELVASADSSSDDEAVLANRALREFRPKEEKADLQPPELTEESIMSAQPPLVEVNGVSTVEPKHTHRALIISLLGTLIIAIFFFILYRLRH